jgi:hypothetical protein
MLNGVWKFLRGKPVRRGTFLSAWWNLGLAWWNLRRQPVRDLLAGFGQQPGQQNTSMLSADQLDKAAEIGRAVRAASSRTPWPSSCLVQALAAQRMLQARGIGGVFFIGADTADGQGNPGFDAHAWLMCGGEFITGEAGWEKYTALAEYRWE